MVLIIYFMYTKRILESIGYFYIFLLTQKVKGIYWVFLLIVVDTERILDI
jgi:hypothetical protein